MYLKQIDIHGFKTFADKTSVVFKPGITCIVGPNGSGKSNISDAIMWVLGENNVRELRGSSAQDVIFSGNDRRRPLGMAEVSLTIDNSGGLLPLDFSEITVTRRLYRSGESEYRINKVNCRLKDIYELFLDTGVGRDAYSMINQGEIDQILSVRAEDRRAIFEEAAGIKKYRVRKRETERKLEHTQQNLLRVNDIVVEIEAQLGPLQRQAVAAKRYRELAVKLRELENAFYGQKLRRLNSERGSLQTLVSELQGERKRLDGELATAQEREKAQRDALQSLDAEIEALRTAETTALQRIAAAQAEKARAEERAGEVQRRLAGLARELNEINGRIEDQVRRSESTAREEADLKREVDLLRTQLRDAQALANERRTAHEAAARELEQRRQALVSRARRQAEIEAKVQSTEQRSQSLVADRARAVTALEDGEAELERLTLERESFLKAASEHKEREQSLAAELEAARQANRAAEQALSESRAAADRASRTHQAHAARLQALSELGEKGEGAAQGARQVLDAVRKGHLRGKWSLLLDGLAVPEGMEKAVEAALGVYADALLCDTDTDAVAALQWLKQRKSGAIVLVASPEGAEAPLLDSLGELLQGADPALAWGRHLLAFTLLAHSLEQAQTQRTSAIQSPTPSPQPPSPILWVTRTGEWMTLSGAVSNGAQGAEGSGAAVLARRRELERLRSEEPALAQAADAAREAHKQAEAAARKGQGEVRERQSRVEAARMEHLAQSREADRRKGDVDRTRQRVERLRADLARVDREQSASAQAVAQARAELERSAADPTTANEPDLAASQAEVGKLQIAWRDTENQVTELRVRSAQVEQRLQSAIANARRAVEAGTYLDRQRADRLKEQRELSGESEQRNLDHIALTAELVEAEAATRKARELQAAVAEQRQSRLTELNTARTEGQDLNNRLRELMERTHRAEVELSAVNTQRTHLGREWVDASVSAHSLEASQADETGDLEEPLSITPEGLLAQWNPATAELVLTSYTDPEAEIGRMRRQIRALGAINPDAVEQYAQAAERHQFLTSQRADLESARAQLEEAIKEIDAASRETFLKAFHEIAAAFDEMFQKLFNGGRTELRLTDPHDVLETGIDVIVQPPGKKQQNLLLLSGGERALTATAMLFALLKVRPSPFCVMDEVDAPLDESNVGRFIQTLRDFSDRTQFVLVTHNRGTMEGANTLYGVTMEERGVSKILACSLDDPVVARVEAEQRTAVVAG